MESRSIAAHEREFMWLMFAAADDPSALWAAEGLRARGVKPLEWITPQMLAGARRWEPLRDTQGAFFEITLAGRCIHSSAVQGVLNRLIPCRTRCCALHTRRISTSQELTAFFLAGSMLYRRQFSAGRHLKASLDRGAIARNGSGWRRRRDIPCRPTAKPAPSFPRKTMGPLTCSPRTDRCARSS